MAESDRRDETIGTGAAVSVRKVRGYGNGAMLPHENLALLVQVEDIGSIILDGIVVSRALVISEFLGVLAVAHSNPLVTSQSTVAGEIPSKIHSLRREMRCEILHAWLLDGRHHFRETGLVTVLDSNKESLGIVGRHIWSDYLATTNTFREHVEGGRLG